MSISNSENPKNPDLGPLDHITFVTPKKRKYPGFRKNLSDYFTEFSSNTGIHGFKYMGEQERSITEKFVLFLPEKYNFQNFCYFRLYWLVLFCISLYICISLIIQTWIKWDQTPVLVSFAQSPTPVWQVPFPAITICSETKIRQRVYNFTDYYHKVVDYLKTDNSNLTAEE